MLESFKEFAIFFIKRRIIVMFRHPGLAHKSSLMELAIENMIIILLLTIFFQFHVFIFFCFYFILCLLQLLHIVFYCPLFALNNFHENKFFFKGCSLPSSDLIYFWPKLPDSEFKYLYLFLMHIDSPVLEIFHHCSQIFVS